VFLSAVAPFFDDPKSLLRRHTNQPVTVNRRTSSVSPSPSPRPSLAVVGIPALVVAEFAELEAVVFKGS